MNESFELIFTHVLCVDTVRASRSLEEVDRGDIERLAAFPVKKCDFFLGGLAFPDDDVFVADVLIQSFLEGAGIH